MALTVVGGPPRYFAFGTLAEISTWLNNPVNQSVVMEQLTTVDKLAASPANAIWVAVLFKPVDA